ncbi:MAG: endo-1,4-beta-xylanase [Planctomycetota bacterium]
MHHPKYVLTTALASLLAPSAGWAEYVGRADDAAWRAEADARIEQYRKGGLTLQLQDGLGRALSGASVRLSMREHAFKFGATLNERVWTDPVSDGFTQADADQLDRIHFQPLQGSAYGNAQGRRMFNAVTVEFGYRDESWGWGVEAGRWFNNGVIPPAELATRRANAVGMDVLAHYITEMDTPIDVTAPEDGAWWNQNGATDARDLDEDGDTDWQDLVYDRIAGANPNPGGIGRIADWHVLNHFGRWTGSDLAVSNEQGVEIMKLVRQLDPGARLWVNENWILTGVDDDNDPLYRTNIQYLFENDAAPDGIGFQAHFGTNNFVVGDVYQNIIPAGGIPEILARLEQWHDEFGLAMQVSEFDIQKTLPQDVRDDFATDLLIAAFSHPGVTHFNYWGVSDRVHDRAVLFDSDWKLTQAGLDYLELVLGAWWTEEAGVTDAEGVFDASAFLGIYSLEVELDGQSYSFDLNHLDASGQRLVITIPEAAAGSCVCVGLLFCRRHRQSTCPHRSPGRSGVT